MAPNSSHLNPGFKVVSHASSWRRMYFFLRSQQRLDSSALFIGLDPEFAVAPTRRASPYPTSPLSDLSAAPLGRSALLGLESRT